MFALLLAAGILGICGLKKKKFSCLFVMFFFILTVEGMAMNVALNSNGIFMALSTNDEATTDRFLVAKDIEQVATMANIGFCTTNCPCNWTNTAEQAYSSSSNMINFLQTNGAIASGGKTKFQDCPAPAWYSEYEKPAAMMAALETLFNCSGFTSTTLPAANIYQFTSINTMIPIPGNICVAHYDTLVYGSTFVVGGQFFSISIGALFLWVWIAIVGMNHGLGHESMN